MKYAKPSFQRLSSPTVTPEVTNAFTESFESAWWEPGNYAFEVERRIEALLGPDVHVVATASATAALAACYHSLFTQREVTVSPLTYPATWSFAPLLGYPVEFVDVDPDGWPIYPVNVGVELWGRPYPDRLLPTVVLDSAHRFADPRHGDLLRSKKVEAIVYSFNCQKEIAGIHGGAVCFGQLQQANVASEFLWCGRNAFWDRGRVGGGIKGYLQDPLAAIILEQIQRFPGIQQQRKQILDHYDKVLGKLLVTRPGEASGHLAVIRLPDARTKGRVVQNLDNAGVETSVHYPVPEEIKCPRAYKISCEVISIPCHELLTEADQAVISNLILSAL